MRNEKQLPVMEVVAQHAASAKNAISARDRAIKLAREKGYSLRQIAAIAELTPEGVRLILARQD